MNAIVLSQNPFGLAPKILNVVDGVFAFCKVCRMVDSMDLAVTLENAKDNHFSCDSSSTFGFANTTKIAFIQFNIAIKHLRAFLGQIPSNDLPDFLIDKESPYWAGFQAGQQQNGRSLPVQKNPTTSFEYFHLVYNELSFLID